MRDVVVDPGTTRVVWASSVITAMVILAVHLTRWFLSPHRNLLGECLVCMLAVLGVVVFLRDVRICRIQSGMCKLIVLLLLANPHVLSEFPDGRVGAIVPRLFGFPELEEDDDDDD